MMFVATIATETPPGLVGVIAPYLGVFLAALLVALVLTPVMRHLATKNGVVDQPDLQRKGHSVPVAYLGGVAIFLGWLVGVGMGYFIEPHRASPATDPGGSMTMLGGVHVPLGIILGAAAVMFTGLFDDLYNISPRVKIGGQLFAAAALASQDVGLKLVEASLELMGLPTPELLVLALGTGVLAMFVLGGCNAFNLIDGMDGLAAGVTAIGCVGLLVIAALVALAGDAPTTGAGGTEIEGAHPAGDAVRLVMCLAILGAVLGFLPYNFHPARIFMGDAGALLLGFLVVATILLLAEVPGGGPRLVTAALIVFMVPIADTAMAIVRRKLRGRRLTEPDNEHLHHMLCRGGLSVRQSVVVLYLAAATCAGLGCMLVATEQRWRYVLAVFVALLVGAVAGGIRVQGGRHRLAE